MSPVCPACGQLHAETVTRALSFPQLLQLNCVYFYGVGVRTVVQVIESDAVTDFLFVDRDDALRFLNTVEAIY